MELTDAQLAANRRNAQQSTGPRSAAGKAQSAQNATTHGLLSRRVLLPDEDPDAWAVDREQLLAYLVPVGPLETLLAERIVELAWRLRRMGAAEAGFLRAQIFSAQERRLRLDPHSHDTALHPLPPEATEPSRALLAQRDQEENNLGRAVASSIDVLTKLSRYEVRLERSLHKTVDQLARAQDARQRRAPRGPLPGSAIIDVAAD